MNSGLFRVAMIPLAVVLVLNLPLLLGRRTPLPKIRHHWTVNTAVPGGRTSD